jgi:glycerol uptake facilitator protein
MSTQTWRVGPSRGVGWRGKPSAWDRFRARTGGEAFAEFLGTFVLILLGCGSVAVALVGLPGSGRQTGAFGPANWLIICLGWGLGVTFGVYVAGGISGAHLNPAITLAWAWRRDFPYRKIPAYVLAQLLGAFAAAAIVYALYHPAFTAFDRANKLGPTQHSLDTFSVFATFPASYYHGAIAGPLLDQVVGTAVLVGLIAALIDRQNQAPEGNMSAWLVGFVVVAIGLSLGTDAGYAINPARDLAPRLFTWVAGWGRYAFPGDGTGFRDYWWIPIVGPVIGALVGVFVYDLFIGHVLDVRPPEDEPSEAGHVPAAPQEVR